MFIWPSIIFYCLFSTFAFYNQKWSRDFKGASQVAGLVIAILGFAAMLTGFAYLGIYAFKVSWIGAGVAFVLSLAFIFLGVLLERLFGTLWVQVASVFLWPIFAVLMFWTMFDT